MKTRICSLEDCNNIHFGRSYCNSHYQAWKKHGDPLHSIKQPHPWKYRFFKNIVVGNDCWQWTGGKHPFGYGNIHIKKKAFRGHRLAYMYWIGEIPKGMSVCHKCDNPECCNPSHLFLATPSENTKDMLRKQRNVHGERVNTAKLTEKLVRQIRKEYVPYKITLKVLGEKYGVRENMIHRIIKRKAWRYVA